MHLFPFQSVIPVIYIFDGTTLDCMFKATEGIFLGVQLEGDFLITERVGAEAC
jgi:hypothetical protein